MAKRKPVVRGLRKRWLLSSMGPVIVVMVLIAFLAAGVVDNTYYGGARSSLEAKAKAGADYFNTYTMNSYSEYYRTASLYVASFDPRTYRRNISGDSGYFPRPGNRTGGQLQRT